MLFLFAVSFSCNHMHGPALLRQREREERERKERREKRERKREEQRSDPIEAAMYNDLSPILLISSREKKKGSVSLFSLSVCYVMGPVEQHKALFLQVCGRHHRSKEAADGKWRL